MKKKLFTSILTVVMIVSTSVASFAAPPWDLSTVQGDATITDDITATTPIDNETPVYGYIGEDAEIEVIDPTDPDEPPVITPSGTEISVTVPTKIIWAAFVSTGQTVDSPNYYIRNNSANVSLKVTLTDFTARTTSANTAVDPYLSLNISGSEMARSIFTPSTGISGNTTPFTAVLTNTAGSAHTWNFKIGGAYTGSFATARQPEYDMTLRFTLH